MLRTRLAVTALAAITVVALATTANAGVVNPVHEAQNLLVSQEREAQFDSPGFVARMVKATEAYQKARHEIDPGRHPNPNSCTTVALCPIDPRLEHWRKHGGIVKPVLYTARSGATLSGHIWATKKGPRKRPAVLIINGSIIGFEQIYWFAAQALARAGFVVMTFDSQGEGMSDQFGAPPDRDEGAFAGTPVLGQSKDLGGSGLPFYDGGEDSLDFLLSTPQHRYEPVRSRTTHTSHADKQRQRVKAGLDAAYDPLWRMVDRNEIGVAGHSYGAEAASWLAQSDHRIKAGVAWDDLCDPIAPAPSEVEAIASAPANRTGLFALPRECFGAPYRHSPTLHTPVLGLSSDYLLFPQPYTLAPDPDAKSLGSLALKKAHVDTGEIVIRGGTHYEFNDTPTGAIPASKRGIDMVTWYTVAWFARYLEHARWADRMLLTTRWRNDTATRKVDPTHDANLYSTYYRSSLDIHLVGGGRFDCGNLQAGHCAGMHHRSRDCGPRHFSYYSVDVGREPVTTCARRG